MFSRENNIEQMKYLDDSDFPKMIDLNTGVRIKINDDVLRDVEMVECFSDSRSVTDEMIDFTVFNETKGYLREILSHPIRDKLTLNKRQRYLQKMMHHDEVNSELQIIKGNLSSIKWLLTTKDKEMIDVMDTVYLQWWVIRAANVFPCAITSKNTYSIILSPTIGIISPVMYIILPYLVVKYKYKIDIPFKLYLKTLYLATSSSIHGAKDGSFLHAISCLSFASTIFFYFHGMIQSLEHAKQTYSICHLICGHVKSILYIYKRYHALMNTSFLEINPFYEFGDRVFLKCIDEDFSLNCMDNRMVFTNFGKLLKLYRDLNSEQNKYELRKMMNHLFILDALCSIKTCIISNDLTKCSYDFHSRDPYIVFDDSRHIGLSSHSIGNNVSRRKRRNTILTGPNASGKSTFIKGVLINIILSQTISHNATTRSIITPFDFIGSQINIPDCKGKESLFEAEMYRCKRNFDYMKRNKEHKCILFMDEIFNSTNFVEGVSGAYSILAHMSSLKNCIVFVTTHYPLLTKLNEDYNYHLQKFDCQKIDGKITYDYKLRDGVCDKYVALDILEENGYDYSIINFANQIKKDLISKIS